MLPQTTRRAFDRGVRLVLVIACTGSLACSFSYSSKGSSDSSKSSSDSSGSSSGGSDSARFQKDVEQYTQSFVEAGGQSGEGFLAGLGDLARKRGVSDWESQSGTWQAIGRGLGHAHVTDAQRTAYEAAWADGNPTRQNAIAQGYAAAR
jgi:hypothetical protein